MMCRRKAYAEIFLLISSILHWTACTFDVSVSVLFDGFIDVLLLAHTREQICLAPTNLQNISELDMPKLHGILMPLQRFVSCIVSRFVHQQDQAEQQSVRMIRSQEKVLLSALIVDCSGLAKVDPAAQPALYWFRYCLLQFMRS